MINLLPPKEKAVLILEQRKNLAVIFFIIFLVYLVSLILVLCVLNFAILEVVQSQKDILTDSEKIYQDSDFMYFKNLVEKNNQNLDAVNNFYQNNLYASDVLKLISGIERPEGLGLTDISIQKQGIVAKNNSSILKISLYGVSINRDILSKFKENLEKNPTITNLNFPPDNWLKAKNINFYFTFEIHP